MKAKCDECSFSTKYGARVKQHKQEVHGDMNISCEFPGCNFRTRRRRNLKVHKQKHETKLELRRPHACTFEHCDYRAAEKTTLRKHFQRKHTTGRTKSFNCPLCPSRYYSSCALRKHISCHAPEQRWKCSQCKFTAHLQSSVTAHEQIVHNEAPAVHSCLVPHCDFSTVCSSYLKRHERIHSTEARSRPFQCPFAACIFRAGSKYYLKKHIGNRHNPNRVKFTCPLCAKDFLSKSGLRYHIRNAHTNEKFHRCKKCAFATTHVSILKRHCKMWHENSAFHCLICDHKGSDEQSAWRHSVTHCVPIVLLKKVMVETQ